MPPERPALHPRHLSHGCPTPVDAYFVPFRITKAERYYLIDGLRKLDARFAHDIAERLEATKCQACGGNGYAPYVGGDDDETRCATCDGTGHANG